VTRNSEGGCQRTEDGRRKAEARGQRPEARGQRPEDRGQRAEGRGQRTEVGCPQNVYPLKIEPITYRTGIPARLKNGKQGYLPY